MQQDLGSASAFLNHVLSRCHRSIMATAAPPFATADSSLEPMYPAAAEFHLRAKKTDVSDKVTVEVAFTAFFELFPTGIHVPTARQHPHSPNLSAANNTFAPCRQARRALTR
jgi:hypothetical protein